MNELVSILGSVWPRILLYPGGLTLLLFHLVLSRLWFRSFPLFSCGESTVAGTLQVVAAAVASTTLPFPRTAWTYSLDLVTALALLEAPYWIWLRGLLRDSSDEERCDVVAVMSSIVRVYPLVAIGVGLLATGASSLQLSDIRQSVALSRWLGVIIWATALPPLLHLGPWRHALVATQSEALRRSLHVALLVVLALPVLNGDAVVGAGMATGVCAASYLILDHHWHGATRTWDRWQPWLALAGLVAAVGFGAQGLLDRLR